MTTGFGWILLSLAMYGGLHSLLAARRTKAWVERRLGASAMRFYRLGFSILGGLTFLPSLALAALLPDQPIYNVPAPWAYLLRLIQLAGVIGVAYGVLQTGALRFIGLEQALGNPNPPSRLVTGGLYRWMRHPLYTCSLLALWFNPTLTWNLLALNLGVTLYFIIGARFEENKLLDEFGPAYAEYQARTPAFIPRPGKG